MQSGHEGRFSEEEDLLSKALALGSRIKSRRKAAELTQLEVVEQLQSIGVCLSRAQLANYEAGSHHPIPETVLAGLDSVLAVSDVGMIGPEGPERGQRGSESAYSFERIKSSPLGVWADLFTTLSHSRDRQDERCQSALDSQNLRLLVESTGSDQPGEIGVVGSVFSEAESLLAGNLLVDAMRRGWIVRQIVAADTDRSVQCGNWLLNATRLARCSRYRIKSLPPEQLGANGLLVVRSERTTASLVVPKYTASSGLRSTGGSVVALTDPSHVEPLVEFYVELLKRAAPLYTALDRQCGRESEPCWSFEEIEKADWLTSRSDNGTWHDYALGWVPSSMLPPVIFSRKVRLRAHEANRPELADHLVTQQLLRHTRLFRRAAQHPVRVILDETFLESFIQEGSFRYSTTEMVPLWRVYNESERATILNELCDAEESRLIEIRVRRYGLDEPSYFEARGGKNGYVALRTRALDQADTQLDLLMDSPQISAAYALGFEEMFVGASETLGQAVKRLTGARVSH